MDKSLTRVEFLQAIREMKISSGSYSLDKKEDECYNLLKFHHMWKVYYGERGLETGMKCFHSESDALEYLFNILSSDPAANCY